MSSRIIALAAVAALATSVNAARGEDANAYRVIYFGNSFLGNSVPWFHPTLAESAGHQMEVRTHIGPGWQMWMHVDTFHTRPEREKTGLVEGDWDAVVIQHFGSHPLLKDNVRRKVFHTGKPFPKPRDVSDLASASTIIDLFLSRHPDRGKAFIYNSWPGMPAAKDLRRRVREETRESLESDGLSRQEVLKTLKERKPTYEEMVPLMRSFDYAGQWLAKYDPNRQVPHASRHAHSRDYVWQLMEELKKNYPELWKQKRLALIPHGDVFLALDKKMRAGKVPGVERIGFYSRDGGHVRAGLPRYTLAATCFAVMFGEHPRTLDGSIYNDLDNYTNANLRKLGQRGYVHQPDLGKLLEMTPDRVRVVNDTIWEVVTNHPYTQLKGARDPASATRAVRGAARTAPAR